MQNLSLHLLRELRSDHAGETGAVYIYKGIVAVATWRKDEELLSFAKRHCITEADHLRQIEEWLPIQQRSWLLGPWRLAGWLTGALPAVFGRRSVYGTIAAVETFVDQKVCCRSWCNAKPMSSIIVMSQQHWQGVNPTGFCELGSGPLALVHLLQSCWRVAFEMSQGRNKRLQRPSESKCQHHSLRSQTLNG
jgi:hypothetical protein